MRLSDALKDHYAELVLAEATLARLGLTDEAAMIATDKSQKLCGIAVACDRGLAVFSVKGATSLHAVIHPWRDVSPPTLNVFTEEKMETILIAAEVSFTRPQLDLDTPEFALGNVEWRMDSRDAIIEFWRACTERAVGLP